jgi:hypothetical protein
VCLIVCDQENLMVEENLSSEENPNKNYLRIIVKYAKIKYGNHDLMFPKWLTARYVTPPPPVMLSESSQTIIFHSRFKINRIPSKSSHFHKRERRYAPRGTETSQRQWLDILTHLLEIR